MSLKEHVIEFKMEVKQELTTLKKDMSDIKIEITALKKNMSDVKIEIRLNHVEVLKVLVRSRRA